MANQAGNPSRVARSATRQRLSATRRGRPAPPSALVSQFHGQAGVPGRRPRAPAVFGAERASCADEAEVVHRTPQRQAVLAHQLASGSRSARRSRCRQLRAGHLGLPELPHRVVKITDVMLDQVQANRRVWPRQLPRRRARQRRAGLLSDLDDDAMSVARVQERLPPMRIGQLTQAARCQMP